MLSKGPSSGGFAFRYVLPPPCIWATWGRFVILPVLCLLAYGDTALKSEFLLAFGAHKKGCDNDTFRAVFLGILRPPNAAKKGKTQNDKSTLFYPPNPPFYQGVTNVHLSNVHFVLHDISALLDPSWGS